MVNARQVPDVGNVEQEAETRADTESEGDTQKQSIALLCSGDRKSRQNLPHATPLYQSIRV